MNKKLAFLLIGLGIFLLWFGSKTLEYIEPPEETFSEEKIPTPTNLVKKDEVFGIEGERVLVTKVIDGDTIVVEGERIIRLIGIDTPETVHPKKSVECFGKEASNEMKKLLSGKAVILQKDVSETDKYQRFLRYIFLPLEEGELLFVNDYLLRQGFAVNLTYPPDVKYSEQFLEAEKFAREKKLGLWLSCR